MSGDQKGRGRWAPLPFHAGPRPHPRGPDHTHKKRKLRSFARDQIPVSCGLASMAFHLRGTSITRGLANARSRLRARSRGSTELDIPKRHPHTMPRTEDVLTIFLASPSDVADERSRFADVIRE